MRHRGRARCSLRVEGKGGAVFSTEATIAVIASAADKAEFTGNHADEGPAIYNGGELTPTGGRARAEVSHATFADNVALADGAAIYNEHEGDLAVADSAFTNNLAWNKGGAIDSGSETSASIARSTFDGNRANGSGGAVMVPGHDRRVDVHRQPAPMPPTTVVIADDHPFYRQGLGLLLRERGIDVVAEVPNGETAIRAVAELAPDVVVMDLNMPGLSGLEATRRLTAQAPASRVLILSVSAHEADVTEAILAGASGYVLKDGPVEEIVTAIQAAAAGQFVTSPEITTYLLQRVRDEADDAAHPAGTQLSGRELEVLGLMAEGKSNHEIGAALVISASTVCYHISNILNKLRVENRVQAAVRAVRCRLV